MHDSWDSRRVAEVFMHMPKVVNPVFRELVEEALKQEIGIAVGRINLLELIADNPGVRLKDLARDADVSASGLSVTIDRMVAEGLVRRSEDPRDRRRISLELTEAGRGLLDRINEFFVRRLESWFSTLPEEDLRRLGLALCAITEIVSGHAGRSRNGRKGGDRE
ncbi:MAG: MarR family winged helix-turn-helix transcriptional regulator [Firmicutes bacterium]|nr:MarR family winged helix-turn-helix transcriptional regulator [Bacillota bacterium]